MRQRQRGSDVASNAFKRSIIQGDLEAVKEGLESGEDLRLLFYDGSSALSTAISHGHTDVAHLLLDRGADPFMTDSNRLDGMERQPIHYAAGRGMLSILKRLLDEGVHINDEDQFRSTAMHYAARSGQQAVIECLIASGGDISACDSLNQAPLWDAVIGGHTDVMTLLLQHGADPNNCNTSLKTVLMECIQRKMPSIMIETLRIHGASLDSTDIEDNTALHYSALSSYLEAGEFLIKHGCDVNAANQNVSTALHLSAMLGDTPFAVMLLNERACFKKKNKFGDSALCVSLKRREYGISSLLAQLGASLSVQETAALSSLKLLVEYKRLNEHPQTLKSICRCVIRDNLRGNMTLSSMDLPLPKQCIEYVLLKH